MGISNSFIPRIASIRLTKIIACFFDKIPETEILVSPDSIMTLSSSISISKTTNPLGQNILHDSMHFLN